MPVTSVFDKMTEIINLLYLRNKKIICLDATEAYDKFIKPYCIDHNWMPFPTAIYDIHPEKHPSKISGVPVLTIELLTKESPEECVLFITSEDKSFYQYLGRLYNDLKCYYFLILPCTALDAYFYAKTHLKDILETKKMFDDTHSQSLYELYWINRISGCVYHPLLFSEAPYFGNYVVPELKKDDVFVIGGAYNGNHIDRALKQCDSLQAHLFEPNPKYFNYLSEKYKDNKRLHIYPFALYHQSSIVNFNLTDELGAKICDKICNIQVETITIDSLSLSDVSLIALDIEGAESQALEGAKHTINEYKPALAICAYHKISDYVNIPNQIKKINPDYRLFFMQHSCYYEESVIYGIV